MGRAALLLGVASLGCSSVVRAPPMLGRRTDAELHTSAPTRATTAAELRPFITERLGELASALEPMCGPDCRRLETRADSELEPPLALNCGQSPSDFVVLYRPDGLQGMLAYSESLATWGLAHEMGHYVDIAIAGSERDDPWRLEMSADAVAGCAFRALGLHPELVRAALSAAIAPEDSLDSRLDLVCGSDSEHPAIRWELEAFDTGAQLCRSGVVSLEQLEGAVTELREDAKRAAERARAWFPATADPCRWRRLGDRLPQRQADRK